MTWCCIHRLCTNSGEGQFARDHHRSQAVPSHEVTLTTLPTGSMIGRVMANASAESGDVLVACNLRVEVRGRNFGGSAAELLGIRVNGMECSHPVYVNDTAVRGLGRRTCDVCWRLSGLLSSFYREIEGRLFIRVAYPRLVSVLRVCPLVLSSVRKRCCA
jgi:hypothetical protein